MLARGRCVASGTIADVLASAGAGSSGLVVRVAAGEVETARRVLAAGGFSSSVAGDVLHVAAGAEAAAAVNRSLAGAGMFASELRPAAATLEDAYLRLVAT